VIINNIGDESPLDQNVTTNNPIKINPIITPQQPIDIHNSIRSLLDYPVSNNLEYAMARSRTVPMFLFAGPIKQGIPEYMRKYGLWAPTETQIFYHACFKRCSVYKPIKSNPLVIDVGSHVGMFTIYPAAMGCRVKSYEPNTESLYYNKLSVYINGLENNVEFYQKAVGAGPGEAVMSNDNGDLGSTYVVTDNNTIGNNIPVPLVGLRNEIKEDVLLIKINVEGYEDEVMKGLYPILDEYNIENIKIKMKKTRDYEYKRVFINALMHDYLAINYSDDYGDYGVNRTLADMDCVVLKKLGPMAWIPWEDMWFIKKGSDSYQRALTMINCIIQ
jgi:FkbM family methyltransferase